MTSYPTRRLGGLAWWIRPLLLLEATASGVSAVLAWQGGQGATAESTPYALLALAQLLFFVTGFILFLIWVYRSNANAHGFGAQDLGAGPALAVAWYFIPIANLWMPLANMRETWKASVEPRDWEIARAPATLTLWWLFWLAANIAGVIGFRLGMEQTAQAQGWSHRLILISDALTVPGALLLAMIVGAVSRMQDDRIAAHVLA